MGLVKGGLKDIGKAFSAGFDLPHNIKQEGLKGIASSMRPHIGGAIAGAGIGLALGTMNESEEASKTALVGGAIGATALPMIGLAGGLGYGAGVGVINNADKIAGAAGKAGMSVGRGVAKGLSGPGFSSASAVGRFGNNLLNPVQRHASTLGKFADNFASYTPPRQVFDAAKQKAVTKGGFKLGPLGWGTLAVGAAIGATRNAAQAMDDNRAGQRDAHITRATPSLPAYANNAGATGDLVFALNRNRRG